MTPSDREVTLRSQQDMPPEAERLLQGELSGQKRKAPEKPQNRFKVVAQLVMAMNRFTASLNPTYTYGKRTSASGSVERKVSQGESSVRPGRMCAALDQAAQESKPVQQKGGSEAGSD